MCSIDFNGLNPINGIQNQALNTTAPENARDNSFVRETDYQNTPNPAEMHGRSMIQQKNLSRKELVDKLFNNKLKITNKEVDDILRDFGCDESKIQDLRKKFPDSKKLNLIINALKYQATVISGFDFSDLSDNDIEKAYYADEKFSYLEFFNEDNVKLLESVIKNDQESPYDALLEMAQLCFEGEYSEKQLKTIFEKAIEISDLYEKNLSELVGNLSPEDCEALTSERLLANKALCDVLGYALTYDNAAKIKNPELVTPEFVEKYANEHEKLRSFYIEPAYCDPVEDYPKLKMIADKCEEYGFDFSKIEQLVSLDTIERIIKSDKVKQASELFNALNDETKQFMRNTSVTSLENDKCLDNAEDFAALCNEIVEFRNNQNGNDSAVVLLFNDLLKDMRNNPDADLKGAKKVAEAFIEAGCYPSNYSAYPLFSKDYNGTNNYDGKIAFIKELKEFYGGENSEFSLQDYMKEPWREGFYSEMPKQFEKLKKAGLYGKIAPSDLRHIFENADKDEIVEKVIKLGNEPFFKNQFHYYDDVSADEMKKEFDILKEKIRKCNPEYENLSFDEIVNILEGLTVGVKTRFHKKVTFNKKYDEYELSIDNHLQGYKPEIKEFALELLKKDSSNPNVFSVRQKTNLLKLVNENINLADMALDLLHRDFTQGQLLDFLSNVSADGIDFLQKLVKEGKYSNDELWCIAKFGFTSEKEVKTHQELLKSAFENRDLLKNGLDDLTDDDIKQAINQQSTVQACNLVGKGNLESTFALTKDGFEDVCKEFASLIISPENKQKLLQKINPTASIAYISLANEISELKTKLNQALGEETSAKINEINLQREEIDAKIAVMKKDLKEKPENSQEYADLKKQISNLQKQSKILGGQAQTLYFKSQNAAEIKDLMGKIKAKNLEMKEIANKYSDLSPQTVIDKTRALAAISEISNDEEMAKMIDLIDVSNPEKEKLWDEVINKKIYEKIGVEYDEKLSQKLDLIHCKYLGKMIASNDEFFENMKNLVQIIKNNPEKSVAEAINSLPQNVKTKQLFAQNGFDYENWVKFNPDSYTLVETKLDAEKAKKQAIDSLEEDLNDELFKKIPQNIQAEMFSELAKIGITFEKSEKDVFEGDGFNAGRKTFNKLYKDGKPIVFDDMKAIINCIKSTINKNQFWTTKQQDPTIENARGTLYTHLIKLRAADIDNAKKMKDGETVKVKVSKTDMNDIKKALGLGNDAQCCTALGRKFNEHTAPNYIKNKCIGAIELTDNGNFAGNTMIYLANVDGKPALVLDNIELKTRYQNNDAIRDAFVDYAKKLCAEIGKPDMSIYAGPNRHKLDLSKFPKNTHLMQIIGNTGNDEVYLDYDAEHHKISDRHRARIEMYKIK